MVVVLASSNSTSTGTQKFRKFRSFVSTIQLISGIVTTLPPDEREVPHYYRYYRTTLVVVLD